MKSPKRTGHWFQFSLRTLLVVTTLIFILLGTVVNWIIVPAERQRMAVEEIKKSKGLDSILHFVGKRRVAAARLPESANSGPSHAGTYGSFAAIGTMRCYSLSRA